jgi:hypothetical protein
MKLETELSQMAEMIMERLGMQHEGRLSLV